MVRLLAVAILLSGGGRALATPPDSDVCAMCDEESASPEILVTAEVVDPFSVETDDARLSMAPLGGFTSIAGGLMQISFPSVVNAGSRDRSTASFTIGGVENQTILIQVEDIPKIDADNPETSSPLPGVDRRAFDLEWSGEAVPSNGSALSGTFPATITLGDNNGTASDGHGGFRIWIGGAVRNLAARPGATEQIATIKMYYLE